MEKDFAGINGRQQVICDMCFIVRAVIIHMNHSEFLFIILISVFQYHTHTVKCSIDLKLYYSYLLYLYSSVYCAALLEVAVIKIQQHLKQVITGLRKGVRE